MSQREVVVISISDRPLGAYRVKQKARVQIIPTVPLEYVNEKLEHIIGENRLHQREFRTGTVLGYIQDAIVATDIIEHSMFLYVETMMGFRQFLERYATIPDRCPVCNYVIDDCAIDERLAHIIQCRWTITRAKFSTPAKKVGVQMLLH